MHEIFLIDFCSITHLTSQHPNKNIEIAHLCLNIKIVVCKISYVAVTELTTAIEDPEITVPPCLRLALKLLSGLS